VLWPSGTEGVPAELRALCEVVTDWFAFSESVIRMLSDREAQRRVSAARDRIAELLSATSVYAELKSVLDEAVRVRGCSEEGETCVRR